MGGKIMDNNERRKIAGLIDDHQSSNFITKHWFKLVVIAFLTLFAFQLNGIKKEVRSIYIKI